MKVCADGECLYNKKICCRDCDKFETCDQACPNPNVVCTNVVEEESEIATTD